MPQVILHLHHFFMHILVIFDQLVSLFLAVGQFANQDFDLRLQLSQLRRIAIPDLIAILLILILSMDQVALDGLVFIVVAMPAKGRCVHLLGVFEIFILTY